MCCLIFFGVFLVPMYRRAFFLIFLLGGKSKASDEAEPSYECGRHGRFEYCIDGIPGCVVGCHCHPGYYFDTDSKICEPNTKLTNDYRRHYRLEPTRAPMVTFGQLTIPTLTTTNPIDEKVDTITKDTDDLGDWLYNQFFKTIENQVINSTDDEKMTRRSGSQFPKPKSLRRSRKRSRKTSKRKKSKKKGLKKKIMRITEDDSLFDSSSDSSSDESSSSTESDSDSSDDEHGHRKILLLNKKPKPPLPSFIFLPNTAVNTPFYPPIGLPPPPAIVPMYPMVPVPPVDYQGHADCNDDSKTTTTTTTTTTASSSADTTTDTTTAAATQDTTTDTVLRARESPALRSSKHGHRNKLQQFREKMKRRNKPPSMNFLDNYPDPETPYANDPEAPPIPFDFRSKDMYDQIPPIEDVDFKYLSQLIHKIDLNKTKPDLPLQLRQRMMDAPNRPFRRTYSVNPPAHYDLTQKLRPASKADEVNDSYYSNLGKQIASLIRKVDTDGERRINIEIEQQNQDPMQTILNENRYSPRSYWERFIRSPLKQSFMDRKEINRHSSESLFDLEDQVRIAAEIERTLSLQELENIANIMQTTQSKISQKSSKNVTPVSSSRGYNINLLPRFNRRANSVKDVESKKMIAEEKTSSNMVTTLHRNIYPTHISQNAVMYNNNINKNETQQNLTILAESKNKLNFLSNILKLKAPHKTPLHHQVSRIVHKNITNPKMIPAQQIVKYQLNPMMINYKSLKYIGNNHNKQYQVQQSFMPFNMPFFSKPTAKYIGRNSKPSYFHHELHHFDYFE
ncbi:uncharacterized protein LOC135078682 [Ostrinia nubilalis]|uniref:uncharacterized protein LOC135078682 n=1 Tax=Ostrinia nubilalis TaxID=29057 RepID=UPI0030822F6C